MRKLLNTLYITTAECYLSLDGETILVRRKDEIIARLPLLNFESIVKFGHIGMSPALMGYCVEHNIPICFLSKNGRFLARVVGEYRGNVLLRKRQYRLSDSVEESGLIARNILVGKFHNSRSVIERTLRDHTHRVNANLLRQKSSLLLDSTRVVREEKELEVLRGIEGRALLTTFPVLMK